MSLDAWSVRRRPPVRLPEGIEGVFERYLRERYKKARGRALEDAVAELSDAFTTDRRALPPAYLGLPPIRSAYLAYHHPLQMLRGLSALSEVWGRAGSRSLLPVAADRPLRVADLGAGLGALSQALLARFAHDTPDVPWPELVLVDHQRAALRDARELTQRVARALRPDGPDPVIRTAAARVDEWARRARERGYKADVVLLGAVLNEGRQGWDGMLASLLDVVAPDGLVVIVEPALSEVGRRLMALRDTFLAGTTTIAPCTHALGCPLLAFAKDWCFTTHTAEFPERTARLAQRLGHQFHEVRYAFWAFTPRPDAAPFEIVPARHGRVISDAMDGQQLLCADGKKRRFPALIPQAERGTLASR